jgi:hypothetical protein
MQSSSKAPRAKVLKTATLILLAVAAAATLYLQLFELRARPSDAPRRVISTAQVAPSNIPIMVNAA